MPILLLIASFILLMMGGEDYIWLIIPAVFTILPVKKNWYRVLLLMVNSSVLTISSFLVFKEEIIAKAKTDAPGALAIIGGLTWIFLFLLVYLIGKPKKQKLTTGRRIEISYATDCTGPYPMQIAQIVDLTSMQVLVDYATLLKLYGAYKLQGDKTLITTLNQCGLGHKLSELEKFYQDNGMKIHNPN